MHKPTIGDLVASGFRAGFSRNALIAATASLLVTALVFFVAFRLGLARLPLGLTAPGTDRFVQAVLLPLMNAGFNLMLISLLAGLLASIAFQPFAIGMAEHVFRSPSPTTTGAVILRFWWVATVRTLCLAALMLLGIVLFLGLSFSPLLSRLMPLPIAIAGVYVALGFYLAWPFAVYEQRFSVSRAYQAMRGQRWRMLGTMIVITLPFTLLMIALYRVGLAGLAEWSPGLTVLCFIAAAFIAELLNCCMLGAATHLYLWLRQQPPQSPFRFERTVTDLP